MNEKMIIPKVIHVGYNDRSDTYTGKLAYVIYTDAKGKKRKEVSWNSWCSKDIPKDDFDNEAMSGFVINKDVGGAKRSYGWNTRMEKVRVYDPRGFEIEVSIPNLLFILEECNSIKGKGLEGEFIYSWYGTELVLLPTCSNVYKECSNFTAKQGQKVTKGDMVEGCTYLMKDMTNVMYLGRHEWCEYVGRYIDYYYDNDCYIHKCGNVHKKKKHIFLNIDEPITSYGNKDNYIVQAGFTKLAERTSDEPISSFADAYTKLVEGDEINLYTGYKAKKTTLKYDKWGSICRNKYAIKKDDGYRMIRISSGRGYNSILRKYDDTKYTIKEAKDNVSFSDGLLDVSMFTGYNYDEDRYRRRVVWDGPERRVSKEEMDGMQLYELILTNDFGAEHSIF